MTGGFPVDLILFAMVAAFLVLRLRGILGRRTGYERPPAPLGEPVPGEAPRTIDTTAEDAADGRALPAPSRDLPAPASPAGQALTRIRQVDPGFEPAAFLDGAEGAFRMIVTSFASGDRETLKGLLAPDVYADFEAAVTAREQAAETQRTEVVAFRESTIVEADLRGTFATIGVRFVTDQINLTTGQNGILVAGSEAVIETIDIWSFARDLAAADPTWLLVGTRSE